MKQITLQYLIFRIVTPCNLVQPLAEPASWIFCL